MCWNASPSLKIVSDGVRLMHGCFSLVHAEGHCWLALQRHTHTHTRQPWCHAHTLAFILEKMCFFRRMETVILFFGPFAAPKNVENSNNHLLLLQQHSAFRQKRESNILWELEHVLFLGLLSVSMCNMAVMIQCRWHVWCWIKALSLQCFFCTGVHQVHRTQEAAINHLHFCENGG